MTTKQIIVEKADHLFRTYGIRSVTVDDICKECGISKKTIYKYYTDKYALASKTLKFHYDKLYNEINIIISNSKNSITSFLDLSTYFRTTLNQMTPSFVYDLKKYNPDLYQIHQKSKEKLFVKTLEKVIKDGKNEGLIRKEINEKITSKLRIEMIESGLNQDVFPLSKYDFNEIQLISFDLFLRGIITKKGLSIYENKLNN